MKSRQTHALLIVFTRYPEPGTTKTRLAKALGDLGAADTQKQLTEHTLEQVRKFLQLCPMDVSIYHAGGSLARMQEWLGPDLNYLDQGKGDLGLRLGNAVAVAFKREYSRLVIIGTDCPDLQASHIIQAFAALLHKDLVLGPATDGGYYLIGLSRNEPSLFNQIPWGTPDVLVKTLNIAAQTGLTIEFLEKLSDVDRPEDLKHFNHRSGT